MLCNLFTHSNVKGHLGNFQFETMTSPPMHFLPTDVSASLVDNLTQKGRFTGTVLSSSQKKKTEQLGLGKDVNQGYPC